VAAGLRMRTVAAVMVLVAVVATAAGQVRGRGSLEAILYQSLDEGALPRKMWAGLLREPTTRGRTLAVQVLASSARPSLLGAAAGRDRSGQDWRCCRLPRRRGPEEHHCRGTSGVCVGGVQCRRSGDGSPSQDAGLGAQQGRARDRRVQPVAPVGG